MRVDPGPWSHSFRLSELHTAKEWGLIPSEFDRLDPLDKAEMMGHDSAYGRMQAYDAQREERKLKRLRSRSGMSQGFE